MFVIITDVGVGVGMMCYSYLIYRNSFSHYS